MEVNGLEFNKYKSESTNHLPVGPGRLCALLMTVCALWILTAWVRNCWCHAAPGKKVGSRRAWAQPGLSLTAESAVAGRVPQRRQQSWWVIRITDVFPSQNQPDSPLFCFFYCYLYCSDARHQISVIEPRVLSLYNRRKCPLKCFQTKSVGGEKRKSKTALALLPCDLGLKTLFCPAPEQAPSLTHCGIFFSWLCKHLGL